MKVLGTAGHVDHGKSALVMALTGINPDRLQEEIERQMTIDLGFAWMTLSDGEEVGIVDVPGHRDFIENMLAGVDGFDAALLVVASDEGVMPQTREHLIILDLLGVEHGVIAITKIDLLNDPDWLPLVKEEVEELIENTSLQGAQIVFVSAKSGEGLDELKMEIGKVLQQSEERVDRGKPRLPIDRAFTISGFGTVVTGTLKDGSLKVGDEVQILPGSKNGRIRGLQTHKVKVDLADPGSRTAVNISGVDVNRISRGDVLVHPGTYTTTTMIDVHYQHVPGIKVSLKHDHVVKIYIGAAQRTARVRVLGVEEVLPGGSGILQLMIDQPILADRGDHFILRRPSPGLTLGGGVVIDAFPKRRHRRFDEDLLVGLKRMVEGGPEDMIAQFLVHENYSQIKTVVDRTGIEPDEAQEAIKSLISKGEIILTSDKLNDLNSNDMIAHKDWWEKRIAKVEKLLSDYQQRYPLRFGIPREELKSRVDIDSHVYATLIQRLEERGIIDIRDTRVSIGGFQPVPSERQSSKIEELLKRFHSNPFATPSVKECIGEIGEEVYSYLLERGELIQVSGEVVFHKTAYTDMVSEIQEELKDEETITVAQVRDLFDTSRKYALALMEYLDSIGVTVRVGDERRLPKA